MYICYFPASRLESCGASACLRRRHGLWFAKRLAVETQPRRGGQPEEAVGGTGVRWQGGFQAAGTEAIGWEFMREVLERVEYELCFVCLYGLFRVRRPGIDGSH